MIRLNHPFLPSNIPYITQAGLFDSRPAIQGLTNFLKEKNHDTTGVINPGILFGRSMESTRIWFTQKIDEIRMKIAKSNTIRLKENLERKNTYEKEKYIKRHFLLDEKSNMADFLAKEIIKLFEMPSSFFSNITALTPKKPKMKTPQEIGELSKILFERIEALKEKLAVYGEKSEKSEKSDDVYFTRIVNEIFDRFTPRVAVLGGHSMGGITALQAMQKRLNDISFVIGWGSPINGANPDMVPLPRLMTKFFPMLKELNSESEILKNTRETSPPSDSTFIGVELKDRKDGTILGSGFSEPSENMHHIEVDPKKSRLRDVFPLYLLPLGLLCKNPITGFSHRLERLKYHTAYGYKVHVPFYWSSLRGSLLGEFIYGDEGIRNAKRLLHRQNYSQIQIGFLIWLKSNFLSLRQEMNLETLKPELDELLKYELPFKDSEDKIAEGLRDLVS